MSESRRPAEPTPGIDGSTKNSIVPIAGIGASAGGLEALEQLVSQLGPLNGYAIILVTHMAPDQKSMLGEILSRRTEIPITEAVHKEKIEAGRIYVISPNSSITIKKGRIIVHSPVNPSGIRLPIDTLFSSLAEECGKAAIGVILSGSGSDGSVGIRAIKEHGGMVIAQKPETAKADSMPRSAINTGIVDMVLEPEAIPGKIKAYVHQLKNSIESSISDSLQSDKSDDLLNIIKVLRDKTHCDFSNYKASTMARRIEKRVLINKYKTASEYLAFLKEDSEEADKLYKDLLISVTYFFRDPEVFQYLADEIMPRLLLKRNKSAPLRIWCAGCSTGEEAYSIAITVHEYLRISGQHLPVKIFATDINGSAIEMARSGIFSQGIIKKLPSEILQRYFTHRSGSYVVSRSIRDMIIFAPHDLLADPPFYDLDLISCRNLLIYLRPNAQEKIFSVFYNSLKKSGSLLLGTSEAMGKFADCFKPLSTKHRLYQPIPGVDKQRHRIANCNFGHDSAKYGEINLEENYFSRFLERHLLKSQSPPAILINESLRILNFHGNTSPYLRDPEGTPTDNIIERAVPSLKRPLRSAIHRVLREKNNIVFKVDGLAGKNVEINVEFVDAQLVDQTFLAISFIELPGVDVAQGKKGNRTIDSSLNIEKLRNDVTTLTEELDNISEDYRATTEKFNSSNEELMSMNEELQSSNEELESSKEELQALNEELTTVNSELNNKITELHGANDDIHNILNSSKIPFFVLDIHLKIKHFTPNADRIFHILPSDTGRPIDHVVSKLVDVDLKKDCQKVLKDLKISETEVRTEDDCTFIKRVFPYQKTDNKLDGLIITFSDVTDIKKTEAELHAHKNRLEMLVEERSKELKFSEKFLRETGKLAMVGGWELSWNRKKVLWTEETYNIFEVDTDFDPSLEGALDFYPPESRKVIQEALERCVNAGSPFDLELKIITDKGNQKWIRTIGELRSASPKILGGAIMDITKFHNTKMDYESILYRLKEAQSIGCVGDWEWNILENKVTWSEELYRLMDIDRREEPPGKEGNMTLYHPEDSENLNRLVGRAVATGESFEQELRRTRPNGEEIIFISRGLARKDKSGKVTHLYGILLDITQRKKQEAELAYRHKKLKAVIENTTDAYFEVDTAFKVVEINEKALPVLQCKREDIEGKILWDVFPEAVDTTFYKEYNRAISEKVGVEFEEFFKPLNAWYEVHAYPSESTLSVYFRDITDRKQYELNLSKSMLEAKAANKAKSEFLANMSHEIRTPLNGIQGNLQLLHYTTLDDEQLELLNHTETASESLLTIINDILDLSRIESGKVRIDNQPFAFKELINSLHAIFDQRVAEKQLKLSIHVQADVPDVIVGDISRLRQILVNLIGNSIKFTSEGSISLDIHLLSTLKANRYRIGLTVTDTGIGISDDLLPVIFEPFSQGKENSSVKGTGLGLAIVKRLVDMMDGKIQIDKVSTVGTCIKTEFVFEGCVDGEQEKPEFETIDKDSMLGQKSLSILVAEDDLANRLVLQKMLTVFGHDFHMANDGEEALQILKSQDIDLILMDMQMPVLDGIEATRKIRTSEDYAEHSDIPIIALTAHAMKSHREKALSAGMDDFLTKPIGMKSLKQLLDTYIRA